MIFKRKYPSHLAEEVVDAVAKVATLASTQRGGRQLRQHHHEVTEDAPSVSGKGGGIGGQTRGSGQGVQEVHQQKAKGKGRQDQRWRRWQLHASFQGGWVHRQACLGLDLVGTSAPPSPDVRAIGTKYACRMGWVLCGEYTVP
ncbi:hypothetical protein B0H14DRAFT_2605286 [Mycena olivaceomarginata]|nr:hypothetical protein B0H14DRAFT_2605286 [Mycena olivaceomarginata]